LLEKLQQTVAKSSCRRSATVLSHNTHIAGAITWQSDQIAIKERAGIYLPSCQIDVQGNKSLNNEFQKFEQLISKPETTTFKKTFLLNFLIFGSII